MLTTLGQPAELTSNIGRGYVEKVRPVDGMNHHRILFGPVKARTVYYPTTYKDKESGEVKAFKKPIIVPESGSIFDEFAAIDKRLRNSMGEKDPKSTFTPSLSYLYLIFNRAEQDKEPVVRVAEYRYSVVKDLIELEKLPSTVDSSKLMWGPIFTWDAMINKQVDPTKPKIHGVKYKTTVNPETAGYMGAVPIDYLKLPSDELIRNLLDPTKFPNRRPIFTEGERKALNECELNLVDLARPLEMEEIVEALREFPIDLNAADSSTGLMLFPRPKDFVELLNKVGGRYLLNTEPPKELPSARVYSAPQAPTQAVEPTPVPAPPVPPEVPTTGKMPSW